MADPAFKTGAIHLIDSMRPGGVRTGENAFEEAQTLGFSLRPIIQVHHWREPGPGEILRRLANTAESITLTSRAPIIHFEAHGTTEGLETASGEFLSWANLKGPLTRINVICRLNLLVLVSACDGEGLAKVIQLTDRAYGV